MRTYQITGAKGGQGATTVATVVAALAAGHVPTTLAARRPDDVCALAGVARNLGRTMELTPNLALAGAAPGGTNDTGAQVVVEDLGRLGEAGHQSPKKAPGALRWLVVRGPCYLGLRSALEAPWQADGVVLLVEPGRPLTAADVIDVLGVPVVAEIPVEAAVARVIDAGLLLARLHHLNAFRRLAALLRHDLGPDRLTIPVDTGPSDPQDLPVATDAMRLQERETSSTDYAASSKLPPSGCRERRRPAPAALASKLRTPARRRPCRRVAGACGR